MGWLRAESAEKLDVSRESILRSLQGEAHFFGPRSSQSALISALATIAKIEGYMVNRTELKGQIAIGGHVTHAMSGMSHEQLMAIVDGYRLETKAALESGAEVEAETIIEGEQSEKP